MAPILAGCSISGNLYAIHPDTIRALRWQTGKVVKLAPFTSDKLGKSEIICRLVGMIQTPGALAPPGAAKPPPIPLPDLREWAPGKWRSTGRTNTLVIDNALRWSWESSFGGKWSGSGRGEIQDGWLILRGFHSTSMKPMMLRLVREGDALVGELHISRQYTVMFVRE